MLSVLIPALGAFTLACYGWGRLASALFYPGNRPLHAFSVGLGLVVLAFIGGLLNAVGVAFALPISIAAYTGILLSGVAIEWRALFTGQITGWILAAIIAGVGVLLAVSLFSNGSL